MSFKKPYLPLALIGLVLAVGAAWWFQNKPAAPKPELAAPGSTPNSAAQPAPASAAAPGSGGTTGTAPGSGAPQRPPAVEVAKVEKAMLVDETQSVGSLRSFQGVILRPEVGGRVSQVLFKDGQKVKKGQVLVQFDDQLPSAQLAQSKAELSIAQANHTRNQELVAQNFISKRSLDESDAALQVAQAKLAYKLFTTSFSSPRWDALARMGARVQRPLWASTSTKNPLYPDTLYVDQLIGPSTVNTLPDQTMEAFADHGAIARTIDANVEDAESAWIQLRNFGIDMTEIAAQLELEGVESFQKSFQELIAALEQKLETL